MITWRFSKDQIIAQIVFYKCTLFFTTHFKISLRCQLSWYVILRWGTAQRREPLPGQALLDSVR
jgi:hypothetical protein